MILGLPNLYFFVLSKIRLIGWEGHISIEFQNQFQSDTLSSPQKRMIFGQNGLIFDLSSKNVGVVNV